MKTIVCYGDSNTWGHKSLPYRESTPSLLRFGADERWTGILQARLGAGYRVEEEGLNGRTTMFDDPLCDCRNGLKCIDYVMTTKYPVPAICVGVCRGGRCHSREEWLDISSLEAGCRLAMALLEDYLG